MVILPNKLVQHAYPYDIAIAVRCIENYYPEYLEAWNEIYDDKGGSRDFNCYNCEMFYASKKDFDGYCDFLFGVLFEIWKIIGPVDRPQFHKRYLAFIGERLLSVYMLHNGLKFVSAPGTGKKTLVNTISKKVQKALNIDKDSWLYKVGKRLFGQKLRSSYKK